MPASEAEFSPEVRARLLSAPVGRLATITPAGRPHVVPVVFALVDITLYTGVDHKPKSTDRLARLANRVPCKLNLIPYNPTGLDDFSRATPESMQRFAEYLYPRTYAVTIRQSQGKDIFAACGQLAGRVQARSARIRRHREQREIAPARG